MTEAAVALKERAEEYTAEEIFGFIQRQVREDYDAERLKYLIRQNAPVVNLFGPKGMGKTMLIKKVLYGTDYAYLQYFRRRKMPTLAGVRPEQVLVVDDIHYIIDDIRAGRVKPAALLELLRAAVAHSQTAMVFLVSEDAFYDDYIPGFTLACEQYELSRASVPAVCTGLGVHDDGIQTFFHRTNPTPRSITLFVKHVASDWDAVLAMVRACLQTQDAGARCVVRQAARRLCARKRDFGIRRKKGARGRRPKRQSKTAEEREMESAIWECFQQRRPDFFVDTAFHLQGDADRIEYKVCLAVATEMFYDFLYSKQGYLEHLWDLSKTEGAVR